MKTPLDQLKPNEFDEQKAKHLLLRSGFGGTERQIKAIANLGLEGAVDYIIDYDKLNDKEPIRGDEFDPDIMRPATRSEREGFRRARQSGDETMLEKLRQERQRRQRADRKQIAEMERWWFKRIVETPKPFQEKMTLFWHGHFATGYRAIENSYHMFLQNNMFRKHALGNFKEDLVRGIIHDPAMIKYLNNDQNKKSSPNENLARELMELFTLGEGDGYTEDDIKEGARALTGYNIEDDVFAFRANLHDTGTKTIFGRRGTYDGDDFVNLIFTRKSVSTYVIEKLYRFFVNDLPHGPTKSSKAFVNQLGNLFKRRDWEIKPIMRALFMSEHFYAPENINSIIKSPLQLIVQAVRTLNTPNRSQLIQTLVVASDLMGQRLFAPPSVKGWDGGRSWINTSTMFVRQNTILYLLTGLRPDGYGWEADQSPFNAMSLVSESNGEPKDIAKQLMSTVLSIEQPNKDRLSSLTDFLTTQNNQINNQTVTGVLTLITAMPEYQLC